MSLTRFLQAQSNSYGGYPAALAEIRDGHKRSHWIWYIFPQIDGLGRSSTAREYALKDLSEACDYLRDPLLRSHYEEIAGAIAKQLVGGVAVETLMGGSTDALKLASSLTLFRAAALHLAESDASFSALAQRCDSILHPLATQGYPACSFTLGRIKGDTHQG